MNYLTLFEGKTQFNKLWPLLDLRAKLDLRLTKTFHYFSFLNTHWHAQLTSIKLGHALPIVKQVKLKFLLSIVLWRGSH